MTDESTDLHMDRRKAPLTFDGFDDRGAFLGELWFSVKGPPIDKDALTSNGIRVSQSKRWVQRWFTNISSVPEVLEPGGQFVMLYVSSLGPDYRETLCDVKFYTEPKNDDPEADPLSFLRPQAFRGCFPDNLPELLHLLRLDGALDLRLVGQYLARRDSLGATLDVIAPWLRQPPIPTDELPREATWAVRGDGILTSVRIRESQFDGAVQIKACGGLRATLSVASAAAIDVDLWREVTEYLASGRAEPCVSWSTGTELSK